MAKKIEISVSGSACSGKTTVIAIIQQALAEKGFGNVEIAGVDNSAEYYDAVCENVQAGVFPEGMREGVEIRVTEKYLSAFKPHLSHEDKLDAANGIEAGPDKRYMHPLVPIWSEAARERFVETSYFPPEEVIVNNQPVLTSALKFGVPLNVMSVAMTQPLLDCGYIHTTDRIDSLIGLDKLYVVVRGKPVVIDVSHMPHSTFFMKTDGEFNHAYVDFKADIEMADKRTSDTDERRFTDGDNFSIHVTGKIYLEMATLELSASVSAPNDSVEAHGFKLKIERHNFAKRPN